MNARLDLLKEGLAEVLLLTDMWWALAIRPLTEATMGKIAVVVIFSSLVLHELLRFPFTHGNLPASVRDARLI